MERLVPPVLFIFFFLFCAWKTNDGQANLAATNLTNPSLEDFLYGRAGEGVVSNTSTTTHESRTELEESGSKSGESLDDDGLKWPSHIFTSWKQHSLQPYEQHSFVLSSSYRMGPQEFVAVGLGALAMEGKLQVDGCTWTSGDGNVVRGSVNVSLSGDHHRFTYQALVLRCYLERAATTQKGGSLHIKIDQEEMLVYREEPGEVREPPSEQQPESFKYNITHCSSPLFGTIDAERMVEWLEAHRHLGVDHVVLHDVGGVTPEVENRLRPYIEAGVVEIVRMPGILSFNSWWWGQTVIINECLYRHRFDSKWLLYLEFDEYLWLPAKSYSLPEFLAQHADRAYLTFGSISASTQVCLPVPIFQQDQHWLGERMVYREPWEHCTIRGMDRRMCTSWQGNRKLFVNPRKVRMVGIHAVEAALEPGLDLSTSEMLHQHFKGILTAGKEICTELLDEPEGPRGMHRNKLFTIWLQNVRQNPVSLRQLEKGSPGAGSLRAPVRPHSWQ